MLKRRQDHYTLDDEIEQILLDLEQGADDEGELYQDDMSSDDGESYFGDTDSSSIDTEDETGAEAVPGTSGGSVATGSYCPHNLSGTAWGWSAGHFSPHLFHFDRRNSDVSANARISDQISELDYFILFFNETIMKLIQRN